MVVLLISWEQRATKTNIKAVVVVYKKRLCLNQNTNNLQNKKTTFYNIE